MNFNKNYLENFIINKKNLNLENLQCQFIKFQDKLNLNYYTKNIELEFNKSLNLKKNKNKFLEYFNKNDNFLTLKSNNMVIDSDVYIPKNYVVKFFQVNQLS